MKPNHGDFDDVGTGTLNRSIGGSPQKLSVVASRTELIEVDFCRVCIAKGSQFPICKVKVPSPPLDGLHIALGNSLPLHLLQVIENLWITFVVTVNKGLSLSATDPGLSSEATGSHTVDDTKIDDFAEAALFRSNIVLLQQQLRGKGVDILVIPVGLYQDGLVAEVSKNAQLDLGIVCRYQLPARFGNESLPNLATKGGPNGNVLQVRVGRGEPPCRCYRLVKVGMDPMGIRTNQLRQGINIGRLELRQRTILYD